jgi:predicted TIM-barrel fold metal-dependent hydrolase
MFKPVRFYDSLIHLQNTNDWLGTNKTATIERYVKCNSVPQSKAIVAKMPKEDEDYIFNSKYLLNEDFLVFYTLTKDDLSLHKSSWEQFIDGLIEKGYKGMKIHPRMSDINVGTYNLKPLMRALRKHKWILYLCTIHRSPAFPLHVPLHDFLYNFANNFKNNKIVFLHGGFYDVFAMGEVVRDLPNVLLDLSFTFMRYRKSSLSLDIGYLFETLDRKICIGTDYPETTPDHLFESVDKYILSRDDLNISKEKIDNIFYGNLEGFIDE